VWIPKSANWWATSRTPAPNVPVNDLNYVDGEGLGALIEMYRKTKAKGGRLMLCNLGPKMRQASEISRLLPIFETCPTEAAAAASF
jgi:stage II sporulation protein AA (anti-sigma F factor antagonist)